MIFSFSKKQLSPIFEGEKNCFLLTNGLGGYCSLTTACSNARGDQALLMAAVKAPNLRYHLLTNTQDRLKIDGKLLPLSSQRSVLPAQDKDYTDIFSSFSYETFPTWILDIPGISIKKQIVMAYGYNTVALRYSIDNPSKKLLSLSITPLYKCTPKNANFTEIGDASAVKISTNGEIIPLEEKITEPLYFSQDERDGRAPSSPCFTSKMISFVSDEEKCDFYVVFSAEDFCDGNPNTFKKVKKSHLDHLGKIAEKMKFEDELTRTLGIAGDAYIVRRDSVDGKTIIAGYPFFEDWGRDTFIALPGLTLATGRFEECKQILETFSKYEKNGLLPNLFPEGDKDPMYNSADAPLLFINMVYRYAEKSGDWEWAYTMVPVMENIVDNYIAGTDYHIKMDDDGLIMAGADKEQVTWMDVCVNGFLPTPRHGKPVEINAYWYSALRVLEKLTGMPKYKELAQKVQSSFVSKFWSDDLLCLKDVLNGTSEETQIRCNQVWALTQPFTMLDAAREFLILKALREHLYTTAGLRTLSPTDPDFKKIYIGPMELRDRAYHQGTVWAYPLGAYYQAVMRLLGNLKAPDSRMLNAYASGENMTDATLSKLPGNHSPETPMNLSEKIDWTNHLNEGMNALSAWLSEGCLGHMAEIYDGETPTVSRGCFAQAWSTAELLVAAQIYSKM